MKAHVKPLRKLPGYDVSAFLWTFLELAGEAYTADAMRDELLVTTFIEGVANFIVRLGVQKSKQTVVEGFS